MGVYRGVQVIVVVGSQEKTDRVSHSHSVGNILRVWDVKEASSYPGNQILGREEPQAQGYFRSCSNSDQNTHGAVGSDRREGGGPQWAPASCIPTNLPSPGKELLPSPKTCHSHGCRHTPSGRALALTSMASQRLSRCFASISPQGETNFCSACTLCVL